MLFTVMGLLLTINIIWLGLYFLFFKKTKNRYSAILGYAYLIAGAFGLFVTMFLWWKFEEIKQIECFFSNPLERSHSANSWMAPFYEWGVLTRQLGSETCLSDKSPDWAINSWNER